MKKLCRLTKTGLVLTLCLCMLCGTAKASDTSKTFPDVPAGAPYEEAVGVLAELGIIKGDDYGNFNPDNTITRAEAATIICRMLCVEEEAKAIKREVFSDVSISHWAVGYIAKAAEIGIINGYGNGNFGPNDPVAQDQIIKMLVCAWGYGQYAKELGGWPTGYITVAEELGIIESADEISGIQAKRSDVAMWSYNTLYVDSYVEV